MKEIINVGILLFNEVEVLDFAGPFEVFSLAKYEGTNHQPFRVKTIAEKKDLIIARNGLKVMPDYSFEDALDLDILIIPGGYGAEEIEIHNETVIKWIQETSKAVKIIASVCTGAFLLAKAGLLDGKKATTHWMDLERLENDFPLIKVQPAVKFVEEGNIITAGGISAGINMSFHIMTKVLNKEIAIYTAKRMEYDINI